MRYPAIRCYSRRRRPNLAFPSPWLRAAPSGATGSPYPLPIACSTRQPKSATTSPCNCPCGEAVTVEKIVTVYTGRDVATSEPAVDAERWLSRLGRFAELLDGHLTEWVHLWERLSIEFDDFTDELRILRLHLLHLLQTVSPNTVGPRCRGAGPRAAR